MKKEQRRAAILAQLRGAGKPLSGAELSALFSVSRQIIVKDIAALREQGEPIQSTAAGYIAPLAPITAVITCNHDTHEDMERELAIIVQCGGVVVDVFVDHPRYGRMAHPLCIATEGDVRRFVQDMINGRPLASLTDGLHSHTIRAPSEEALREIQRRLRALGVLVPSPL